MLEVPELRPTLAPPFSPPPGLPNSLRLADAVRASGNTPAPTSAERRSSARRPRPEVRARARAFAANRPPIPTTNNRNVGPRAAHRQLLHAAHVVSSHTTEAASPSQRRRQSGAAALGRFLNATCRHNRCLRPGKNMAAFVSGVFSLGPLRPAPKTIRIAPVKIIVPFPPAARRMRSRELVGDWLLAQMGPAGRHREPHGRSRKHWRRSGLSIAARRLHSCCSAPPPPS